MNYVMESAKETERLVAQALADSTRERIRLTQLAQGARVLDVGCGPGIIASELIEMVGPAGSVTGIDISDERLEHARRCCRGSGTFINASAYHLPFENETFDYVWSQFVFQYLAQPVAALKEMHRVCRPGGKVVISDFDGMSLMNWPFPAELEQAAQTFLKVLSTTGFDVHVGRKVFSYCHEVGLRDIRVHVLPQYVIAGEANERETADWQVRFKALEPIGEKAFGSGKDYWHFANAYLSLLSDPASLKYSVLLLTEATK